MSVKCTLSLGIICTLLLTLLQASAVPVYSIAPPPYTNPVPVFHFVHTATSANTFGPVTYLDHPMLNANSFYYVFVMQNWNPPGSNGVYNNTQVGVWFSGDGPADPALRYRWAVYNEDGSNIPIGASFNIMFGDINSGAFLHNDSGTSAAYIALDDASINNDPNAILMITHYAGIGGLPESLPNFNHSLGVVWDPTNGRWWILTEDGAAWPDNTKIMVMDVSDYDNYAYLQTTYTNVIENYAWFYDPDSDAHPGALIFATHYLGSDWGTWPLNDHPLGVWYNRYQDSGVWSIFNQDMENMNVDLIFHILIIRGEYIYLPMVSR